MPSSPLLKGFFKDFDLSKVFAVRSKRRTQRSSTATHDEGDDSIPADIPMHPGSLARDTGLEVSINASSTGSFGRASFAREASDIAQLALPLVQAFTGVIPIVGSPMKAAIGGLLAILQTIDIHNQNKADLDGLTLRLNRLSHYLYNAPPARGPLEESRRDAFVSMLQGTLDRLTMLHKRCAAYTSITQAIAGCSSEIDRYLWECSWSSQMQNQNDTYQMREEQQRMREEQQRMREDQQRLLVMIQSQSSVGPTSTRTVTLGCVTLVDATGHEHPIPVTLCTSFQQFNEMLKVLFICNSVEAQIQGRYIEQGQYDLCIDDDKQVTQLTSHEWPSFEEGTKIVMRVTIEQPEAPGFDYKCYFCGAINHLSAESIMDSFPRRAGCSIDCRECKRRFQISRRHTSARRNIQSSNIDPDVTTDAEMQLIRNFHVQQTGRYKEEFEVKARDPRVRVRFKSRPQASRSEKLLDFDAGGTSATSHSQRREFAHDTPAMSRPDHIPPSHDEYGSSGIEEIKEDSDKLDGEDRAEQSGDALSAEDGEDCEEWEDCEEGEDHE